MPTVSTKKKTGTRTVKPHSNHPTKNNKRLNVLSLFSGCGGMDLGMEGGFLAHVKSIANKDLIERKISKDWVLLKSTRFKTIFANDIFDEAQKAWINHFSNRQDGIGEYKLESLVDLVKRHQQGENIFPKNADVVTGGFPCQDFSIAGKRKGFNSHKNHKGEILSNKEASVETRGQLYMWMKAVIEITKPKVFIAENVKGLVNLSNVKDIIQSDFSRSDDNGYIVLEPRVLHAADYGISQNRERVLFIGIRKSALKDAVLNAFLEHKVSDAFTPYPAPTHAYKSKENNLAPFVQLKDILGALKEPDQSSDPSQMYYSKAKFMGRHCQGQTEIKWHGIAPTIRSEHHGNIEFRRLSALNEGKHVKELSKNMQERRLTPRECALIQSFPPDYEFVKLKDKSNKKSFEISPSKAYKMIGNAVPPLLAYHLAVRLENIWDKIFK